ncbi:MAG: PAS domain S-box protein [Pedobacter sp.]|nr:MAG: PAS domain S-box protein [Pedobacter sp.]
MKTNKGPSYDTIKALETAPSMFLVLSPELYIITASDMYLEATQNDRKLIVGRHIFEAFPDNPEIPNADGVKNINASLQEVLRTKKAHFMKFQRYDVPDIANPGKFITRYWDPSHTPILDEDGEISYIIQLATNVTDQVLMRRKLLASETAQAESALEVSSLISKLDLAEQELLMLNFNLEKQIDQRTEQLENSEEKYRGLIEHSPVAMQVFRGEEMRFEIVNEAMLKFLGKGPEIIGKTLFEGVPEIAGQPIVDVLYGVYHTGNSLELQAEEVVLERNGIKETGYYDVLYRPLYDGEVITGVLGIAIDVTPQVKAKLAIQESEVRFRTMAEGSGILISTIDVDGKVDYLNKTWVEFTGKKLDKLTNFGWTKLIHPDDYEQVNRSYEAAYIRKEAFANEFRLLDAEGNYRWLRLRGAPRFNADGSFAGYVCSSVDFTDEKQQLLEIEYINKALVNAIEQLEHSNSLLRDSEENLQSAFNAADLGSCTLNIKTGKTDMSPRYRSLYGLPLMGEITWDMVNAAIEPEFLPEVNLVMENAKIHGTAVDSTYAIRHLETGERRWMRVAGKVRASDDGTFSHMYLVVMDVTVQKQDEQRKNDFIAMVSHELKTPLTSLTGYTQMLLRTARKEIDEAKIGLLGKMERQLKKMAVMIDGFLNISRLEAGKIQMEVQRFDLALLIAEIGEEFYAITKSHQLLFSEMEVIWVNADRDKIGHVVNNLIANAIKYSPSGSDIMVNCEIKNRKAEFSISDKGIGVSAQDLPRLFDRYYRVQGTQVVTVSGFGIGLYLSAEIIQRHGGKIWAESELGKGSVFYFSIPLAS